MTDNNKKSKRDESDAPPGASWVLVKLEDKINIIKSWKHETPESLPLFVMPEAIESDGYYFVAHSRSDFKIVYTDILRLESVGVDIWYDRAMEPSKDWRELARRMMNRQECKGVIVYGTVNSMASEPVQTELLVADELGKNIIFINHAKREKNPAAQILYEKAKMTFKDKCACVEGFEALLARIGNANITYIDLAVSPEKKKDKLDKISPEEVLIYERNFDSVTISGVKYLGVKSAEVPEKVMTDGRMLNVVAIGACAFANCFALDNIKLPKNLERIGEHAFFGCTSLVKVHLGGNVWFVAENAFENCRDLGEVTVTKGNKHIVVKDRVYYSRQRHGGRSGGRSMFFVPRDLDGDITLLDGLKTIKPDAFAGRTGISSIAIPNSVTSIGGFAFSGCACLSSVTIGDGVTSIENAALTNIGSYAFSRCTALISVTIGDSVTSIINNAFRYCYKLVEVYNRSSLDITAGSEGNGYIGYYAKHVYTEEGGSWLTDTDDGFRFLYDGEVGYFVDYYGNETYLTLPESFIAYDGTMVPEYQINEHAFHNCTSLASVTISDSVTSIGLCAFWQCYSLASVTIGSRVMIIGSNAFLDCSSLESIVISDGVVSIGEGVFFGCERLENVNYSGTVKQWRELTAKCPGWARHCPCKVVKCKDGEAPVTAEDRDE